MKTYFVLLLSIAILITGCMPGTAAQPDPTATAPAAATLPAPTAEVIATAAPELSSIQFPETGPVIRLSYDPAVTGPVEAGLVDAMANNADQPFFLVHPAFVQLRFPEFAKGQQFQLPFPIDGAQMIVYQTQDFSGYENEGVRDYAQQLSSLKDLIEKGIDPDHCATPAASDDEELPLLPLMNSAQIFCAKPQLVSFEGGKGIRYVTYYSQGLEPAIEWYAFYTFQGLSDDGQYYLSAFLPIRTNILPNEPYAPGSEPDVKSLGPLLQNQVSQINAQADDQFTPALGVLDDLIGGVHIPGE